MAKPYLIFKARTGFYYAQILLPDGTRTNNKSTGCKNRAEAERKVMEWIVKGTIPKRINSKSNDTKSIDKISIFNNLRTDDFNTDEIQTMVKILKERGFIHSAILTSSKENIPIENFLSNFWDFDKSPYVREKLVKGQSIHKSYCSTLMSRIKLYWLPRFEGKCIGEITRKDVEAFFTGEIGRAHV